MQASWQTWASYTMWTDCSCSVAMLSAISHGWKTTICQFWNMNTIYPPIPFSFSSINNMRRLEMISPCMKEREEKQNEIASERPETCNKKNPKRTKFTVHISTVIKQSHLVHKREFRVCPKPKFFYQSVWAASIMYKSLKFKCH
jgi:hypothetical protein